MRVQVQRTSFVGVPMDWLAPGDSEQSVIHLTMGAKHEVHAIVVIHGHTQYCLIDDLRMFSWQYAWMFEIVDDSLASDWIVRSVDGEGEPAVVFGPEFLAASEEAYIDFVEQVPAAISKMWERWDRLRTDAEATESTT